MKKFVAGTEITLQIAVYDTDGGNAPDGSATVSVSGPTGVVHTDVAASVVNGVVEVTIPNTANVLTGPQREARLVMVLSGGLSTVETYMIEDPALALVMSVPSESAQTLMDALALSFDVEGVEMWLEATIDNRIRALKEAWVRISKLRLSPYRLNDDVTGVDYQIVDGAIRVNQMTTDQWTALPTAFKTAVKRAQLLEAESIINGDPVGDRRREGLLSKTVGEASEMFRSGKQLELPVSSRALRELKGYVIFSFQVSR